jgi:hypothetical protein
VNDPEVVRTIVGGAVALAAIALVGFLAWLFRDRIIRVWWLWGGIDIDKRPK